MQVRTVAVIGAGIMGRGIAHAAAIGGYRTILEDLLPAALRRAESEIRANLDKAVELGKVAAPDADAAFQRLEYAGSVEEAAREADLVIDSGVEYVFSQYHGNRERHLPSEEDRRHALLQSCAQDEAARGGARFGDR
jgi:3-hydroxyacyl-CoA dehydrogenase